MAGDWIKMRIGLRHDPSVIELSQRLGKSKQQILGALFEFWSIANEQTVDGWLPGYTPAAVDDELKLKRFAEALGAVGWLEIREGGLLIPDFQLHNGDSAKRRAKENVRKRQERGNRAPAVREPSAPIADKSRTKLGQKTDAPRVREEKSREENSTEEFDETLDVDGAKDSSLEEGEEEICAIARRIVKVAPAKNPNDRETVAKVATLVQRRQLSEDDLEQALESIRAKRDAGDPIENPQAWLFRTLENRCKAAGPKFQQLLAGCKVPPAVLKVRPSKAD